ncbi:hypothetical protein Syun_007139 [Stephania yunnanensis]|uniref:Uncharacterized protein n=1 Tax=Stephania yunnanensis TaxID=152371 RepID=A0AAP0KXZ7_9MAGN
MKNWIFLGALIFQNLFKNSAGPLPLLTSPIAIPFLTLDLSNNTARLYTDFTMKEHDFS